MPVADQRGQRGLVGDDDCATRHFDQARIAQLPKDAPDHLAHRPEAIGQILLCGGNPKPPDASMLTAELQEEARQPSAQRAEACLGKRLDTLAQALADLADQCPC